MQLKGADGTITVTEEGLEFERSRLSAGARRTDRSYRVPWSSVVAASVQGGRHGESEIRVQVAGVTPPRSVANDPHGIALKHGQAPAARDLISEVNRRAAGTAAVSPTADPVEARVFGGTAPTSQPTVDERDDLLPRGYNFWYRLTMWTTGAALALYVIGTLIFVGVLVALLFAIL